MKSNIYYVLGNPQCSKGWIVIINSWLYDGITDDNDINYKAQYWPSLESTIRWWNDQKGPSGWSKIWSLVNRWLQSTATKECGCDSDVFGVVWNTVWIAIQASSMIKLDAIIYSNIGTVYNGHSCALVDGYGTWWYCDSFTVFDGSGHPIGADIIVAGRGESGSRLHLERPGGRRGRGMGGNCEAGKGGEEGLLKVEGCYRGRIIACRGRTRRC